MKRKVWIGILLLCPFLFHCSEKSTIETYHFEPLDSLTFNKELISLGEKLFFDPKLSYNNTISCASCHQPNRAFTDGKKRSIGIHRRSGKRNAPTLWNVKNQDKFMWEGGVKTLELQAIVPLQDTNEMGVLVADLFPKLSDIPYYDSLAHILYDRDFDPFVLTRALGAYQRSLYAENSAFDDWRNRNSLKDSALVRGYEIFTEKLNCVQCHGGKQFTNNALENNGLYSIYKDQGYYMISGDSSDIGKFKVPTLRNIEITAPYMHDGSFQTLEEVVKHYEKGGAKHSNQSELITPFSLSEKERKDLLYFLNSLTDHRFKK
ncbi:cytochrome-c peroxidase [Brumimicrobium aurantiacum]|uniref:Cytochrome-c peroxidase n=1 Tax=Brumimicrobium aurantiacum TaxID=1737063 RepID=A0A3E1EZF2_9FLAO|nr:cytochrome c peroxidase [Brumimicrobium aurantiacum]RFC54934.1 cytochrome-c peroxidase [Brumimicrobium aurantiacum]